MFAREGMHGFDIGVFETGDFDCGFGAIVTGIIVERAVGGSFCVSA